MPKIFSNYIFTTIRLSASLKTKERGSFMGSYQVLFQDIGGVQRRPQTLGIFPNRCLLDLALCTGKKSLIKGFFRRQEKTNRLPLYGKAVSHFLQT